MTVTDDAVRAVDRDLATEPGAGRAWWFLGTLAVLRNPVGAARTPAVIELTVPPGGSPPLHVHDSLDDSFLLLEGEVVVRCGNRTIVAGAGSYVALPHGVEHTFRVTSPEPAKLLLVHADDSFLSFIESVGVLTSERRLPHAGEFDVDLETIVRVSAQHGAPIVGPSLDETEARLQAGPPLADTSDMVQLHTVFRNAIADAPDLIAAAMAAGDARRDAVATYYEHVLELLHAHHEGEDLLVWPLLLERAPAQAAEISRIAAQHDDVQHALSEASGSVAQWRAAPTPDTAAAMMARLGALGAAVVPHLDEEEAYVLPLAAQHIYASEWGEMPGHAMRRFSGGKLWLILGLVREQMAAEHLAMMDAHMPPPVRQMWTETGESAFSAFVAELRGQLS